MKQLKNFLILSSLFTSFAAQASFLSIGESGEILSGKDYQIGFSPQIATSGYSGVNAGAFLDAVWTEDMSSRFMLGVGEVDFYSSGSLKYIPFPDYERQPAMGLRGSFWYGREGSENITVFQIAPMVSKKYKSADYGTLVPYAAWGLNIGSEDGDSENGHQFFIGTEWKSPQVENVNFSAELALNLQNSVSGINFFVSIPFDNKTGF